MGRESKEPATVNGGHRHRHGAGHGADHGHDHGHEAPGHDHTVCVADALTRARAAFDDKGMKLTPLRQKVFEEIAGSHDAVGAYDLLDRMAKKTGERMAPISVYRAIDALLVAGVVHRIESKNAFYACHTPHDGSARNIALVCERCATVIEVPGGDIFAAIEAAGEACGFKVGLAVAEGAGLCAACAILPADAGEQRR